jgi:hypothetical protein
MRLASLRQSLKDMSEDELRRHILEIRSNRRKVKQQTIERAQKAEKSGVVSKATAKRTLAGISPQQALAMLEQLARGRK